MLYEMICELFNIKKVIWVVMVEYLILLNVFVCWFNFFIGIFIKLVIKLSGVVYGWKSMVLSKIGSYLF